MDTFVIVVDVIKQTCNVVLTHLRPNMLDPLLAQLDKGPLP